jgi:hypothetical protein
VAALAVANRPSNLPADEEAPTTPDEQFRMAVKSKKLWPNGKTLRIKFLDTDDYVQQKVLEVASQWLPHVNLSFEHVRQGEAEIRVSTRRTGHWSRVGTECAGVPKELATMNLELSKHTTNDEFERVALHEFGHVLGCIHEHQSPAAKIPWNRSAVYTYYKREPNKWSEQQVDLQIFDKYDQKSTQHTEFDPKSIMIYPIPPEHTDGRFCVDWNHELSKTDTEFIGSKYPRPDQSIPELTPDGPAIAAALAAGDQHRYRFRIRKSGKFLIGTQGQLDVFLTIYGTEPPITKVAEDHRGGIGQDAKVEEVLLAGDYTAKIKHAKPFGAGPYRIFLRTVS